MSTSAPTPLTNIEDKRLQLLSARYAEDSSSLTNDEMADMIGLMGRDRPSLQLSSPAASVSSHVLNSLSQAGSPGINATQTVQQSWASGRDQAAYVQFRLDRQVNQRLEDDTASSVTETDTESTTSHRSDRTVRDHGPVASMDQLRDEHRFLMEDYRRAAMSLVDIETQAWEVRFQMAETQRAEGETHRKTRRGTRGRRGGGGRSGGSQSESLI